MGKDHARQLAGREYTTLFVLFSKEEWKTSWSVLGAVLRKHHSPTCGLSALIHHWLAEHKCGCGASSAAETNVRRLLDEWATILRRVSALPRRRLGPLFKSSGRSHSMCTSPLRHGEQWDACTRPLLAYCRAGPPRPLGCLIKSTTITFTGALRQGCMQ